MIRFIFSERWTNDNYIVKMFFVFFFSRLQNKVSFSTPCLANEYSYMWLFDMLYDSFLFDAGSVRELIHNEKCLKIILKW